MIKTEKQSLLFLDTLEKKSEIYYREYNRQNMIVLDGIDIISKIKIDVQKIKKLLVNQENPLALIVR